MKSVESFLEEHRLKAESIDEGSLIDRFLDEMDRGLNGEESSLEMIPTYIRLGGDIAPGDRAIVLDAGGTNYRTCVVTYRGDGEFEISNYIRVPMPGYQREVGKREFFSILSDSVERLIDTSDNIGFCFSYAALITEDHDGIPLSFSKEIKAPEVIGERLGESLLRELSKRGHDVGKKRVTVLNDTVSTLLSAKSTYPDSRSFIGFILGTGTNTSYLERDGDIGKLGLEGEERQVINVESGRLKIDMGDLDEKFLKGTENPDAYQFEKMIGGAYLGPFCHLVIEEAIREGVLSSGFGERFRSIERLSTARMSNYLEMPNNKDYDLVRCIDKSDEDAVALYRILSSIIERAGKLTAINISSAILKSEGGKSPRDMSIINADGTTFYKTEFLEFYTRKYLDLILSKGEKRYFKMIKVDNSPIIGASIAAMAH